MYQTLSCELITRIDGSQGGYGEEWEKYKGREQDETRMYPRRIALIGIAT